MVLDLISATSKIKYPFSYFLKQQIFILLLSISMWIWVQQIYVKEIESEVIGLLAYSMEMNSFVKKKLTGNLSYSTCTNTSKNILYKHTASFVFPMTDIC